MPHRPLLCHPVTAARLDFSRTLYYFSLASVLIILGGCATLTVVPAERLAEQRLTPAAEPVAHIYAANWSL